MVCNLLCPTGAEEDSDGQAPDTQRINKQIENELKKDRSRLQNQIKILLLGCGEAGKSTFIKQMKIIHGKDSQPSWSEEERQQFKREILTNVLQCIHILLEELKGPLADTGLTVTADRLRQLSADSDRDRAKLWEHRDSIQAIWEDQAIQDTYMRRNQFNLPDCCRHFLSNVGRVSNPEFLPDSEDILQIRVRTTGVVEYPFDMDGKECIMIDVGGQRNERKKWIHCFEDVLLVMFLVAASEYDQVLEEDHTENRMEESLNLFRTILSYHWFKNSAIALFLNKKDLLEEKIQASKLETYFPSFNEYKDFKTNDFKSAMAYIRTMFEQQKKEVEKTKDYKALNVDGSSRSIYVHETMATDTENIKKVFSDVKNSIIRRILADSSLL